MKPHTTTGPLARTVVGSENLGGTSFLDSPSHPRVFPTWPLALPLAGYPLWWVLGLGDMIWPVTAILMSFYLLRGRSVRVPRGLGIWLLFIICMVASVIEIDSFPRLIGFVYRAALYLAATVVFIYVYNARAAVTVQYAAGVLTSFWLVITAGGYLGVFAPLLSFKTPLAFILPQSLLTNDLVREMAFRRVTQFNPESYFMFDPRPSAPFLYTNAWGNAYSILTPIVIAYMFAVRGTWKFWWLLAALPLSLVPAFLTLNRGMFVGLGVAALYIAIRSVAVGRFRVISGLLGLGVLVGLAFLVLPISERLTQRLDTSSTTADRASLYGETLARSLESPIFGYGAPRPSVSAGIPSAGTQGQLWMVLFSHGFPAAAFFVGALIWAVVRTRRHHSGIGLAMNTAIVVSLVEIVFYGIIGTGLCIVMICAGVLIRPRIASANQLTKLQPDSLLPS
ncbi:hypothetical protein EH165_03435 [Nakamurella antarctica]|uniref:O-Antigen ligase n=1 Tax=Nakamurella antarctica TaxID=1902245 RepID=A0A3G8ZIY6_9ACTN|nr:hypothetical protein [Nakamurella antarctica]AZI57352.1 hypothetical protein EH165_03435 [Nakamurella antarctica]